MNNNYIEMKERHQKEIDNSPIFFAFSNKQFKEAMEQKGLTENDTDKIVSIGSGGYMLKTDLKKFNELVDAQHKEFTENLTNDKFIYDMFNYELANHEYCITYDIEDTINALGLTEDEILENKQLKEGLKKAIENQKSC